MRVAIHKKTGRIIEAQKGNDKNQLEVLVKNAESSGIAKKDVQTKIMTDAEFAKLLAEQIEGDRTYADRRRAEYPSVGEQLDMIWHVIDSGKSLDKESAFYRTIAAVKAKYLK